MMVRLRRCWLQLTTDRRRLTMLCVMIGVALLLWARLIVISNMPRTAVADKEDEASPIESERPTASSPSDNRDQEPVRIVLDRQPDRDPFVVSEVHFPEPAPVPDLAAEAGKSAGKPAEDPEQVKARQREQLQALVDQLHLDAVMSNASLAVIGGRTCRVGGRVMTGSEQVSFTLAEVRQRSVILEFEGHRFELKMSAP